MYPAQMLFKVFNDHFIKVFVGLSSCVLRTSALTILLSTASSFAEGFLGISFCLFMSIGENGLEWVMQVQTTWLMRIKRQCSSITVYVWIHCLFLFSSQRICCHSCFLCIHVIPTRGNPCSINRFYEVEVWHRTGTDRQTDSKRDEPGTSVVIDTSVVIEGSISQASLLTGSLHGFHCFELL